MFSHADSFACSPATARTHARPCSLLLWCSGHSLLLSFLRLFLWHRPARLFSPLFPRGHFSGIMKCRGSSHSVALRSLITAEHKSFSSPKYVVLSRSLRSLLPDDNTRSLRSLCLMMCAFTLASLTLPRSLRSLVDRLSIASLAHARQRGSHARSARSRLMITHARFARSCLMITHGRSAPSV